MTDVAETVLLAEMRLAQPADPETRERLAQLVLAVRQEPGCLEYAAHLDADDPARIVFYERWQSREALETHAEAPALSAWRAFAMPRAMGLPKLTFLHRLA